MKIVLDTNVLISGIFWEGNESNILKACKIGDLTNYISPEILDELQKVLFYSKFKLTLEEIETAFETVISISNIVKPIIEIDVIKEDPADNIFIECALTAGAQYIISGDKHLLKSKKYEGITIINSRTLISKHKKIFN
jgi:putative PIN family toxin of toxin-antitoxin system